MCAIVDAKQNKVYACLYRVQNGKIRRKSGYLLVSIEELLRRLTGEVLFLGDAILLYREKIRRSKEIKAVFAEEKFWYPRVSRAVSLGLRRFQEGRIEDTNSLEPLYLYPKECQIKKIAPR